MKKFYTLALSVALALPAFAFEAYESEVPESGLTPLPVRESKMVPRQLSDINLDTVKRAKVKTAAPAKVSANYSTIDGVCGKYQYTAVDYFESEALDYQIEIVKGEEDNEVYIVGLLDSYVLVADVDVANGTFTIPRQMVSSTMEAGGGTMLGMQVTFLSEFVGTLDAANGQITFPATQYLYLRSSQGFYNLNSQNVFTALDESTLISVSSDQCAKDNVFNITIDAGSSIKKIMYGIFDGTYGISNDNFEYVAKKGSVAPGVDLVFASENVAPGIRTIFVAGLDGDGNLLSGNGCYLYINNYDSSDWESVGKATYGEDYVFSLYGSDYKHDVYEVAIEESKSTPGYYRLVNPYTSPWQFAEGNVHDADTHPHYLYIHAEDPAKCFVEESVLGVHIDEMGTLVGTSYVEYLKGRGAEEDDYSDYYGKLDEATKTITFPQSSLLVMGLGDKNAGLYYGNYNNAFKVKLPEANGVDVIEVEDADVPVKYYNLQGVQVTEPTAGQFVIRVQGDKATKIVVR